MEKLSDFKPLGRVVLPGLGELNTAGLIVLVGPNSSGKSQLLQDIYLRLAGQPRDLVVSQDIRIEKPPYDSFMMCLENEGYFSSTEDDSGNRQLRPRTMYLGMGQPVSQINPNQAEQWHTSYTPDSAPSTRKQSDFLNYFGRLLVTALFLERRLTSLNSTGVIDFDTQPPQHDLHALYLNDEARNLLLKEMLKSFGRAVWPDMSRGNQMSLKVSDEGLPPSAEDQLSYKKMSTIRSIETEGDGIKSYVATCVALLLGRRPVCLIDEPELCLHPPQAYDIGKFIGQYGADPATATIVATHSSQLLRGIIQVTSQVQVVRLTRRGQLFRAHMVPPSELTEALSRPTLRAEAVLDGIFAQAVIVVEADGDRVVYQAAWETVEEDFRIDIHFTTVGGTGGIADTCRLYRTLRIPIAVIADLDMLLDPDRMDRVLESLIDDSSIRTSLMDACADVGEKIRDVPPVMSADDVVSELASITEMNMDWNNRDDLAIKHRLGELRNKIDRMRSLKKAGAAAYSGDLAVRIKDVLAQLCDHGLFMVPVGELEEWLGKHQVEVSKSNKRAWANAAAHRIQQLGKKSGDVWEFVSGVGRYLALNPEVSGAGFDVPLAQKSAI